MMVRFARGRGLRGGATAGSGREPPVISRRKMRRRHMRAKARQGSPTCVQDLHFGPHRSPRIGLTGRAGVQKEDTGDRFSWEVS